jgi:hypothetical protein
MKTAILALVIAFAPQQGDWQQTWRISSSMTSGNVHFTTERSRPNNHSSSGNDVPFSRFQGLSAQALARGGAARFEYVHDAGRLICEGSFANGAGAGVFSFVPNAQYASQLRALGYDAPDDDQLFNMLSMDVSLEFARGIRGQFSNATLKQLIEMRIHGVSLAYIQDVHAAGYRDLTIPDFVEMRIHGVSIDFIRELKAQGYDVSQKKLVEMKIHGVSSDYIRELKSNGLQPTGDELVEMKIHGVSTEFIRESKSLGYTFTVRELVELKIHGVSGDYLRKLQSNGLRNLTAEQIKNLRIHGVD